MPRAPRSRWSAFLVLLVALAATVSVSYGLDGAMQQRDQARFRSVVQSTRDRIAARIDSYEALLRGTRSLFLAQPKPTTELFHAYIAGLELQLRFPGIQGIGFSRRVEGEQRTLQAQIWPEGQREEYFPIVFLEPADRRNRVAIGYDMFSEPVRRDAMERARDSGLPAASRKVMLVQEIDAAKQAGFLIYVPVYGGPADDVQARRRALIGFVYSPFRLQDLMGGIFGSEVQPSVAFRIYDGDQLHPDTLLAEQGSAGGERSAQLVSHVPLTIAGTRWTLRFESTKEFEASSSRRFVPLFLVAGGLMSVLFFLVIQAQIRAREQAEAAEAERARLLELEQRARSESEAQGKNLRALFTQAPAAIAIVRGPDFRYELSNPMNEHLGGGRAMVGKTVQEVLPELEAQGILQLLESVLRTGEPFIGKELPIWLRNPDGTQSRVYINGTYQPLRAGDGSVEGVMVFAYEVTEQVLARQRVEQSERELQQAVRARDDFLAVAGHELKTPLAALQLQLEGIARNAAKGGFGAVPPSLLTRLSKTEAATQRLGALVEELLDVSRLTSGRLTLQFERVDLSALLSEIAERFSEPAARAECRLTLNVASGLSGCWDRMRLDQVISNLIDNALKYGAGKPVELSATALGPSRLEIAVRDHGIGIQPEHRERIFGRFERAVSGRHYAGLGLGLWISRHIVEQLGGTIRFDSNPPHGTTFIVELPGSAG